MKKHYQIKTQASTWDERDPRVATRVVRAPRRRLAMNGENVADDPENFKPVEILTNCYLPDED